MFGETTISHLKISNHAIETTIKEWLFRVPGAKEYIIENWMVKDSALIWPIVHDPSLKKKPKEPKQFAHVVPYQCAKPVQMRFPVVMEFLFGKTVGFAFC